jgi:hypothetical protein
MKNKNKAPPKNQGRARACGSNPSQSVVPRKPLQPAGTTKTSSQVDGWFGKQKTRHLAKRYWRVLREFCWLAYHDFLFLGKCARWMVFMYHVELIRIVLLLIVMYFEYRIDRTLLFGH